MISQNTHSFHKTDIQRALTSQLFKKMANNHLIAIVPFLFLALAVHLGTAYEPANLTEDDGETVHKTTTDKPAPVAEKAVDVVVEGMVYCQSCEQKGTWSFTGATPIALATISVICKDHRNLVSYYKAFQTNEDGYFYAELKGFKMSHSFLDHPLQACKVKLVASPRKDCNLLTNVNYGLYGAPLRYENKRIVHPYYEAIIYAGGPLAFRPAQCAYKEQEADDHLPATE